MILEKLLQGLLGGLDESAERSGIRNCELGEALAVHLDAGLLQAVHEAGIVHAVGLDSGGDTSDPQAAEISLLLLTADVGINAGLLDGLLGHLEMGGLGAPVGLRKLQGLISSLARHHRAFYSCHLLNPPIRLFVRDHLFDALDIGDIRVGRASQATAALGVLLGEDMALERVRSLDLTGLGEIESLLRTAVGFEFRHDSSPL